VLRSVLENACIKVGCSLGDLTVLSSQVDPYRLDTPAGHRDGEWVAKHLDRLVIYANHPTTGIHFFCFAVGNGEVQVWRNGDPIPEPFANPTAYKFISDQWEFERVMHAQILVKRYGLPVLSGVKRLILLVDNDVNGEGQKAAEHCRQIWRAAGRDVVALVPKQSGWDFNDVVLGRAA
jgi:hypothetical protein